MKRSEAQTYEAMPGEHIDAAAAAMVKLANETGQPVTGMFNEISLDAAPGSDPAAIVKAYHDESERRHQAYISTPEYAQRQREAQEAQERHAAALRAALATAPAITLRDPAGWQKSVDANKDDGYGHAGMTFAEQWARVMESRIAAGETLEACADEACRLADDQGITGFMYGCAVSILSQTWIHGEQLRRWHNLKTQIGNEGERANESGGTLNPALLSVG